MSTSVAERGWSAAAFGLAISGTEPTPGLSAGAAAPAPGAPTVVLRPAARRELDAAWLSRGARRLSTVRVEGASRATMTIDAHPDAGYRFTGVGYGRFVVPPAADEVRFAPVGLRWARYLHGQVLPFVAGLHGRELLHAGGVVVERGAIAICGPSGAGKTTLTRALIDAGARFLADDVVALARDDDGTVVAHPGAAISVVANDDGSERFAAVAEIADAAPLHAICLLRRGDARQIAFETLPDPRPLLGAGYDAVRRDPQRLTTQLDLLAAVAAQARVLLLRAPARATPEALASAVLTELS
jgi:hypothetical protein